MMLAGSRKAGSQNLNASAQNQNKYQIYRNKQQNNKRKKTNNKHIEMCRSSGSKKLIPIRTMFFIFSFPHICRNIFQTQFP